MRLPPVRLSLRRWMVAVAGVAIALGGYRAWQLSNLATGYRAQAEMWRSMATGFRKQASDPRTKVSIAADYARDAEEMEEVARIYERAEVRWAGPAGGQGDVCPDATGAVGCRATVDLTSRNAIRERGRAGAGPSLPQGRRAHLSRRGLPERGYRRTRGGGLTELLGAPLASRPEATPGARPGATALPLPRREAEDGSVAGAIATAAAPTPPSWRVGLPIRDEESLREELEQTSELTLNPATVDSLLALDSLVLNRNPAKPAEAPAGGILLPNGRWTKIVLGGPLPDGPTVGTDHQVGLKSTTPAVTAAAFSLPSRQASGRPRRMASSR